MKKYIALLIFIMLVSITAVSAHENQTLTEASDADTNLNAVEINEDISQPNTDVKLEKTIFYDYDAKTQSVSDNVKTHNVVKYYGDKNTKFTVEVYDSNGNHVKGAEVAYVVYGLSDKIKLTNANGKVSFAIKDKIGTYRTNVMVQIKGVNGDWQADNTIKVKSTILPKDLVKFSTSKKKFRIGFLNSKGKALKNKVVKLKIKGKTIKVRTNSKGIVKIKSTGFKVGKHRIEAYNPTSGETRKLSVVVLKKGIHKSDVKIVVSKDTIPHKKLKNGDYLSTSDDGKEIHLYLTGNKGHSGSKHTKFIKAKFFFKNKKTGKIITKTHHKMKHELISFKVIKGYTPFKVTVWYRDKK